MCNLLIKYSIYNCPPFCNYRNANTIFVYISGNILGKTNGKSIGDDSAYHQRTVTPRTRMRFEKCLNLWNGWDARVALLAIPLTSPIGKSHNHAVAADWNGNFLVACDMWSNSTNPFIIQNQKLFFHLRLKDQLCADWWVATRCILLNRTTRTSQCPSIQHVHQKKDLALLQRVLS